ncbi:hypothetical protein LY78DRAFT_486316 [Colletotrichum sublineola]|nr:hypothetical protein LY78DRAFT_486316 [Colletotrichum sublineola]
MPPWTSSRRERRRDDELHDLLWPAGMGGQLGYVGADRQTPFNLSCGIFTTWYGTSRGEKDQSSDETSLDTYQGPVFFFFFFFWLFGPLCLTPSGGGAFFTSHVRVCHIGCGSLTLGSLERLGLVGMTSRPQASSRKLKALRSQFVHGVIDVSDI